MVDLSSVAYPATESPLARQALRPDYSSERRRHPRRIDDRRHSDQQAPQAHAVRLSIVIPTFKEALNVVPLLEKIKAALPRSGWEVVFVDDDSPDLTAALVREIALNDPHVRCVQRLGRRGLASACVEGVLATSAPFVAVMDADLQHDERLLPDMLAALEGGDYDVVIGSRYVAGGGLDNWSRHRVLISDVSSRLSRRILRADVKDPMSGFFMVRRDFFEGAARRLSPDGFKILFDLLASSPSPARFLELPYTFKNRMHGESKLDAQVAMDFGKLLINKTTRGVVPASFVLFGLVGSLGLISQLAVLGIATQSLKVDFTTAEAAATTIAMVLNYTLNNIITYRDQRRKGLRFLTGLLSFGLICSVGLVANVGIASLFFKAHPIWWAAGVAGAVVGSVWNYAMSSAFTWRKA